jgi:hypothetical protein
MTDMDHVDDFAEFNTPPEQILRILDEGDPVTFGTQPRLFVTYSGIPAAGADTNLNPARDESDLVIAHLV